MSSGRSTGKGSPLVEAVGRVMDERDGEGNPGEALTPEAHATLELAEREAARRERRAFLERARRAAQAADAERLARAFEQGRAIRPLLGASRYMSRRGVKVLRDLAQGGNLQALKLLCDLTRALALLEFGAQERDAKRRGAEGDREEGRIIIATFPNEGEKC